MIKLPARDNGQWTVTYNSDKLPDLSVTRNLTFDKEGYLRLSKPVTSYFSEVDDADFGLPLFWGYMFSGVYYGLTDESQFEIDLREGAIAVEQTDDLNAPENAAGFGSRAGACIFNNLLSFATSDDLFTHPMGAFGNDWTDRNISASIGSDKHPLCNFVSENSIAIGDGNEVKVFNTSYTLSETLTLPSEYEVTGIAYNNNYIGITTHDERNQGNGKFFVWDGQGSAANYAYDLGASTCSSPIPYRGSFVFLNGTGQLLFWTPNRLEVLAELPVYFTSAQMFQNVINVNRNESIHVDGDIIYLNIDSYFSSTTSDQESFVSRQPGGIWCYDPAVGLYHRHATSALKASAQTIATSSVNTSSDEITVTTAYPTGTPVRYSDGGSTALSGLASEEVYFTINVDSTTVQLASTLTDAETGTQIDLTGTGNSAQTLQFYPKSDFGQSYTVGQQGGVQLIEGSSDGQYLHGLFWGADCAGTTTTEYHCGGFVLRDTENRGYFETMKFQSRSIRDNWKTLFIKHKKLVSDIDTIVVKFRTLDDGHIVKIKDADSGLITWSDENTFTTTDTQFSNVVIGDEIEIIQGTGSGYLAHVTSISEASGTYTVNIDEDIKNLTASDTARVVVSRWTKLTTITKDTVRNIDGYSEVTLGQTSKQIQFKIELRGEDIEIEELLIDNEMSKPV